MKTNLKRLFTILLAFVLSLSLIGDNSEDVNAAQYGTQTIGIYQPSSFGCMSSGVIGYFRVPTSVDDGDTTIDITADITGLASMLVQDSATINGVVYNYSLSSSNQTTTITIPIDQAYVSSGTFTVNVSNVHVGSCGSYVYASGTGSKSITILSADDTPPLINGATGVRLINVDSPEAVSVLKNSLTATDETDGDVTASIVVSSDLYTGNEDTLGEYDVQFQASDSTGNTTTITVTYKVIDVTDPIITLSGGTVNVEYGSTFTEPGYSALDNYDGSTSVVVTGTVNDGVLGTYTLYYNATDTSGNEAAEKSRTVNVVDTTAPVQTLTGASTIYIEFGSNYTEQGATWSDGYDGSGSSVVSGTVNVGVLGTYTVRYNVTDSNGNAATEITRTVIVRDTTDPTFSGSTTYNYNTGTPHTLEAILEGITASDSYDGDITSAITVSTDNYSGHETEEGVYTVVLEVQDSGGNSANYTLTITVADNQAPVFTTSEKIFTHEYVDSMTQEDFKAYFGV